MKRGWVGVGRVEQSIVQHMEDHLRLVKLVLKDSFGNARDGVVTVGCERVEYEAKAGVFVFIKERQRRVGLIVYRRAESRI